MASASLAGGGVGGSPFCALKRTVFGDKRFGRAFIYHNTADCYYASRGYRLKVVVN